MSNRDNFLEPVKKAVAMRAGWQCSICQKLTVGPSEESPNSFAKVGKAAHIAAAAPGRGSRRYDASMAPEDRAGIGNAIWLCSDHAELIDRDEVSYPAARLHSIKRDHEQKISLAIRTGAPWDIQAGLLAIGHDVVCTGELVSITADVWTLRPIHFVIGDMRAIVSFIEGFTALRTESKFVLCNELGDGRVLTSSPTLQKSTGGYHLLCPIAPSFPRIDAQQLGSSLAVDLDTNDLYLDEQRSIARVSGVDYLPQKVFEILSLSRGESHFAPEFGMRLSEYFGEFRGSSWLDLLMKLDVVRQASIPFDDGILRRQYTPLECVTCVKSVELLTEEPVDNRIPIRVSLVVQGVGDWTHDLKVYMPTGRDTAT